MMDEELRFETDLTIEDWRAFIEHVAQVLKDATAADRRRLGRQSMLVGMVTGAVLSFLWSHWFSLDVGGMLFGVAFMVAIVVVLILFGRRAQKLRREAAEPRPGEPFLGHHVYIAKADGLHHESPGGAGMLRWSAFRAVSETPAHLFLELSRTSAIVIPKRGRSANEWYDVRHVVEARRHAGSRATSAS